MGREIGHEVTIETRRKLSAVMGAIKQGHPTSQDTKDQISDSLKQHGHSAYRQPSSPTYVSWAQMKQRCTNPNHVSYKYYGAKGVTVCPQWDSFVGFLADMGIRPEEKSLDRIDPTGNYVPENCRWATAVEQRANRRE